MRTYLLAPSGTPLTLTDLAGCLVGPSDAERAAEALCEAVRLRFGARHCFLVSTGRAAFALILQALRELAAGDRDEVVVPSYTCYSVPASVARAGLKVRLCDMDPATLDYDYAQLEKVDFTRVLCIASANLYGLPNDLTRLRAIAHAHGTFLLDDAAQSMGAKVDGAYSGTLGDVGFFSLDKGKNITTIDGGIVVTNRKDLGEALATRVAALPTPSPRTKLAYVAKLAVYAALLHPRLYWFPESLPFLGLGTTPYPKSLPIEAYPTFLAGLGLRLFRRLDTVTAARVGNAMYALEQLRDVTGVRLPTVRPGIDPVYLRLPIFVIGGHREEAIARLKAAGIGASGSFPTSVADIPGLDPHLLRGPGNAAAGRWVARHIVTLPTHSYVTRAKLDQATSILRSCTRLSGPEVACAASGGH